jgi:hypothetical protein
VLMADVVGGENVSFFFFGGGGGNKNKGEQTETRSYPIAWFRSYYRLKTDISKVVSWSFKDGSF